MPIVKSVPDMLKKYTAKYSGDNFKTALTAVASIMEARYQAGSSPVYSKVEEARAILDSEGVPSALWGMYIAFVEKAVSKQFSYTGAALEREVAGLKAYFVSIGCSATILDKLVQLVLGKAPSY